MRNGLLCMTHPRWTVGLVVKNGVVVDAPPYARKMRYMGRRASELAASVRPPIRWVWIEDEEDR